MFTSFKKFLHFYPSCKTPCTLRNCSCIEKTTKSFLQSTLRSASGNVFEGCLLIIELSFKCPCSLRKSSSIFCTRFFVILANDAKYENYSCSFRFKFLANHIQFFQKFWGLIGFVGLKQKTLGFPRKRLLNERTKCSSIATFFRIYCQKVETVRRQVHIQSALIRIAVHHRKIMKVSF